MVKSCNSGGFDDMDTLYYSEKSSTSETSGRLESLPSFSIDSSSSSSSKSVTLGSQDTWSSASTQSSLGSIGWTPDSFPLSPQAASTPRGPADSQPPRPFNPVAKQLMLQEEEEEEGKAVICKKYDIC